MGADIERWHYLLTQALIALVHAESEPWIFGLQDGTFLKLSTHIAKTGLIQVPTLLGMRYPQQIHEGHRKEGLIPKG